MLSAVSRVNNVLKAEEVNMTLVGFSSKRRKIIGKESCFENWTGVYKKSKSIPIISKKDIDLVLYN